MFIKISIRQIFNIAFSHLSKLPRW